MRYYSNLKVREQIYLLISYKNSEFLAKLKTDSDRNLSLPISEEIQPLTKYFFKFFICYSSFHSPQVKQN